MHIQPKADREANTPSEASPLLGRSPGRRGSTIQQIIEPSLGIATEGTKFPPNDTSAIASSDDESQEAQNHGDSDLERQHSREDRQNQYEGNAEVRKRMKYIFPAVAIGVFLSAADQTLIVSSYGKIGTELNALNKTSWIATAYFLTLTSFQPLYGKLSDIFGRKICLLFAYFVFGLGCLLCGLAQTIDHLIFARAFAGVGGGGMTTVVSILLSDIVPLRERGKWQGYLNIIYATGAGTGAPLGGILVDNIGWRWAFSIQAPMCLAAFAAVSIALQLPSSDDTDWRAKLRRVDFSGALILVSAVFALLLALDHGSNVSWGSFLTLISLGLSVPFFALFLFVETKLASEPFAPGHIILSKGLIACYACNFFSFAGWLAALFYIPLYFQAVKGLSATQAGVRLIPSIIAGVSGSLFSGIYMQKTGKYFWLTVATYTNLTIGMTTILLFSGVLTDSMVGIVIGMVICGFSNGIGVTTSLIGLIANASPADQAIATACSYLFRSLGSVSGVSLSATVMNQTLRTCLQTNLGQSKDAEKIAERVRQSLSFVNGLDPSIRDIVRQCYAEGVRATYGIQICLVFGAALAAWGIREKALG